MSTKLFLFINFVLLVLPSALPALPSNQCDKPSTDKPANPPTNPPTKYPNQPSKKNYPSKPSYPKPAPQVCDPYYEMPQKYLNKNFLYIPPLYRKGETGVAMNETTPGVIKNFLGKTYDGDIVYHNLTGGESYGGECGLGIKYVHKLFLI